MQPNIQILSTKKVDDTLISIAGMYDIDIDQLPFIETEDIITRAVEKRVKDLSQQNIAVVFTSANAVNSVNRLLTTKTFWKIFCMEASTKKSVENFFGNESIIDTAANARQLAKKIISYQEIKKIVFFCGNQRRNTLPEMLRMNGIELEEVVIYKTVAKPQKIVEVYDALLFFSPSSVKSFFSLNTVTARTQLFAIGDTTANEIKLYTDFPIIIAEKPDPEKLLCQVITHFNTSKSYRCSN